MSESNTTYFIKQVWRQKGDEQFARIPFKEENKAQELSQTTNPVLVLETKTNGGAGAVFAIGRVTEAKVIEEAIEFAGQNGEFTFHVPFAYDLVLANKKDGITREELQEIAGQKFAPQAKGGLYEINESAYTQIVTLLQTRGGEAAVAEAKVDAPVVNDQVTDSVEEAFPTTVNGQVTDLVAPAPVAETTAAPVVTATDSALADALQQARTTLTEKQELRVVIDNGQVNFYPVTLLASASDLVELQAVITEYVAAGGNSEIEAAAREAAATAAVTTSPRFANLIGLAEQLVREGRYESVQVPTMQKAFYRGGNLPSPYLAVELQGKQGHHVLGIDGTLYTVEGKTVQHYLGL